MNQPELFSDDRYAPPIARSSDPETSHQGAAEFQQSQRGRCAAAMLDAFKLRAATANEAAVFCVSQLGGERESFRKRIGDIRDKLRLVSRRRCAITGKQATVYEAINEQRS